MNRDRPFLRRPRTAAGLWEAREDNAEGSHLDRTGSTPMFFDWSDASETTVIAGFHARIIHSERMTFVLWKIDAGAMLPEHSHPHEQVAHVLDGRFEITI